MRMGMKMRTQIQQTDTSINNNSNNNTNMSRHSQREPSGLWSRELMTRDSEIC
jgi:hypothetical protein